MKRMKGGQALVEALKALGADTVFGIPGVHTLEIYDALYDSQEQIRHVLCRHEQGAAMLADGYARASGKPGITTLITGPGLLNAATGIAQAYSDSSPVFTICSENPRPDFGGGRGLLHETKNQLGVASSIVDWAKRAQNAREVPELVYEAWSAMLSGRPRPVYLEMPIDVLAEEAVFGDFVAPTLAPRRRPDEALLAEAARLLSAAERPLIIAGGGAVAASADLRELAARVGAACLTSVAGKGIFDEAGSLAFGSRTRSPQVGNYAKRCDLVLIIGSEMAPVDFRSTFELSGTIIRVDIDPAELNHNVRPDLSILGDAAEAARFLATHVSAVPAEVVAQRRAEVQSVMGEAIVQEDQSHPAYGEMGALLRAALPAEAMMFNDMAGISYRISRSGFPVSMPSRFRFPSGYGTLGWAMPAAVGAKLACPDLPVACVAGDGGFLYTVQELATAAMYQLSLPIVIINNETYDEIRLSMESFGQGKVMGCDLVNPDFMDLAKAFKVRGVRVTDPARDLSGVMAEALKAKGPTIIEIPMPQAPRR